MGYESAGEEPAVPPQPMSKAMVDECVKPGIAQHHFEARPCGGIAG
jgi:hypothetical protein